MTADPTVAFPDLLKAARRGDAAAWNALCRHHLPRLTALARDLLRPFGGLADPSGVAQEAVLRAWSGREGLRACTEGELAAWLRRVLRNVANDQVRSFGRSRRDVSRRCPLPDDSAGQAAVPGRDPSPSAAVSQREEQAAAEERIGRLPPRDGLIVRLRITERLDWEAIAAQTGATPAAVERAYYRALQALAAGGPA